MTRSIRYQGAIIQEHHVLLLKQLEHVVREFETHNPSIGLRLFPPGAISHESPHRQIQAT